MRTVANEFGQISNVYHPDATEVVAYDAAANNTAVTSDKVLRIVATTDCHYKVGAAAVATVSEVFLPASVVELIYIKNGERVSFIKKTAGTGGNAYVTVVS